MGQKAEKLYVLDTNVLLHDPQALLSFAGVRIGIPIVVLEELDRFKKEPSDRGTSAREVSRQLDALRTRGSLREGVMLDNGGILQILFLDKIPAGHLGLDQTSVDNTILLMALGLKQQGYEVTFITKDINARVKADVLGIHAEDYLKGRVNEYDLYKGWVREAVAANELRRDNPVILQELDEAHELSVNQFVELYSKGNEHNYRVFRYLGSGKFRSVAVPKFAWPLEPRNAQQLMTLDLLLDETVNLVSLIGPAGTGKTFLALLAGLQQVLIEDVYEKILVSRPVIPLGPDIGYLPGDVQEKLESWMQPIYDNMSLIMHTAESRKHLQRVEEEQRFDHHPKGRKGKKPGKHSRGNGDERRRKTLRSLEDLIRADKISLEAMTYMRGRSIPYQFIFIDEVQNLTVHEVKTLITRVGEGSKIILAGDPYQIDSPYLDFSSNGLVVTSSRFRDQRIFGTVFLEHSERSELSKLASELL